MRFAYPSPRPIRLAGGVPPVRLPGIPQQRTTHPRARCDQVDADE